MLAIRDLVKVYPGPVSALQGISLSVGPGMFGLLGPNGAGKSTLMKILAGLLEPSAGVVELDGHDLIAAPELLRGQLGYLPQDFGFYAHLNGRDMLAHLLELKGIESRSRTRLALVDELLKRVNLSHAARRKVADYSGGMRQRLGIAQAIAGDPRLIIVDEPTAGLDPEERLRFYRLLSELAEGRLVLLSTHIVEDVAVLCPNFALIRDGRLVAQTTPDQAKAALCGALFEGSANAEVLEELKHSHFVVQAVLRAGRNRVRLYVPDQCPPPGFEESAPTMEDAYLVLMRSQQALALGSGSPA